MCVFFTYLQFTFAACESGWTEKTLQIETYTQSVCTQAQANGPTIVILKYQGELEGEVRFEETNGVFKCIKSTGSECQTIVDKEIKISYFNGDAMPQEESGSVGGLIEEQKHVVDNTETGNTEKTIPLRFGSPVELGEDKNQFRPITSANGLYILDENGDRKPDDTNVYDKSGELIMGTELTEDGRLSILLDEKTNKILIVDGRGEAFENGKSMGTSFQLIDKPLVSYTLRVDGKTVIYGSTGEVLTKDGKAYANGAWMDYSDGKKVFHNRFGGIVEGAISDERGGYYLQEQVGDLKEKIWLHHNADGSVYGEQGVIDTTYVFAKEEQDGDYSKLIDVRTYEQCVDRSICKDGEGRIVYGVTGEEVPEDEQEKLFKDSLNIGGFGWRHFGDAVDTWIGLTSNRYFSLFYSDWETDYYKALKEQEFIGAALGGIEGVSGALCERPIIDVETSGGSFSPVGGGSFAHIESERTEFMNVSDPALTRLYQYTFSMEVSPADCDMIVQPTIINTGETGTPVKKNLVKNMPELKKGNSTFTYRASVKTKNYYDKVCLEFRQISGNCLAGVSESDPICNRIVSAGESYIPGKEDNTYEQPTEEENGVSLNEDI